MALSFKTLSIGIIVMFVTGMMPFSAIIILSIMGAEVLVTGIQQIFFYLGWFINPVMMVITGIIVMRISNSWELSRGVLAGIIMALTYTVVILVIQLTFTPGGPQFLPFSGIEMPGGYMNIFYEMILKAYIFCIAGGLIGAYSVSRHTEKKTKGESVPGGMR